jgi:hypothetical protein
MNDLPLTAPPLASSPAPAQAPGSNLPEYSVSELSLALKRSIEDGFGQVRVRGEISGWKRVGSGHCYFALKDADAVLDAVCWRTTAVRLDLKPEDGMEVVCSGRLTTYPGRSKYQLIVERIEGKPERRAIGRFGPSAVQGQSWHGGHVWPVDGGAKSPSGQRDSELEDLSVCSMPRSTGPTFGTGKTSRINAVICSDGRRGSLFSRRRFGRRRAGSGIV